MTTKLNVNIRTLLTSCELLAKEEANFWRLKKFIKSLETMIDQLKEEELDQSKSKVLDYEERLRTLKSITNYIDGSVPANNLRLKNHSAGLELGDVLLTEMRQMESSKHNANLRKELMNEDSLRRRRFDETGKGGDNSNEAGKYYNEAQEKITEHMLALTRSLKEQTETANRIIKKDNETVSKSTSMTDNNINSLQKETEKLEDHSQNAWKCWMWIMIIFVIVTFIGMVLFMKIFKKKK